MNANVSLLLYNRSSYTPRNRVVDILIIGLPQSGLYNILLEK